MVVTPCSLEPFRNQPSETEIRNCILKLYSLHSQLQRQARRSDRTLGDSELPHLWIIAPSASDRLFELPTREAVSLAMQLTNEELVSRFGSKEEPEQGG